MLGGQASSDQRTQDKCLNKVNKAQRDGTCLQIIQIEAVGPEAWLIEIIVLVQVAVKADGVEKSFEVGRPRPRLQVLHSLVHEAVVSIDLFPEPTGGKGRLQSLGQVTTQAPLGLQH